MGTPPWSRASMPITMPSAQRRPAVSNSRLAIALFIASADASTPECV